jgi:hypothetical protein
MRSCMTARTITYTTQNLVASKQINHANPKVAEKQRQDNPELSLQRRQPMLNLFASEIRFLWGRIQVLRNPTPLSPSQ